LSSREPVDARNHVGEIDISLIQPIAADAYAGQPAHRAIGHRVNGRIAGGGLGCRSTPDSDAFPSISCRLESALRPDERSARYRHNARWSGLTGLPAPAVDLRRVR